MRVTYYDQKWLAMFSKLKKNYIWCADCIPFPSLQHHHTHRHVAPAPCGLQMHSCLMLAAEITRRFILHSTFDMLKQ